MTRPLATCQCSRARSACDRTATQEDLRCDVCRTGCAQFGFGPVGPGPGDIAVDGHAEPPRLMLSGARIKRLETRA